MSKFVLVKDIDGNLLVFLPDTFDPSTNDIDRFLELVGEKGSEIVTQCDFDGRFEVYANGEFENDTSRV
jgi:hypothetical protein